MFDEAFREAIRQEVRSAIREELGGGRPANSNGDDDHITYAEAAVEAKKSVSTIGTWVRRGILTPVGPGRACISRTELKRVLCTPRRRRPDADATMDERAAAALRRRKA